MVEQNKREKNIKQNQNERAKIYPSANNKFFFISGRIIEWQAPLLMQYQ